jgi:hypothetical protein
VFDGHEVHPSQASHDSDQDITYCTSEAIQGYGPVSVLQLPDESENLPVQAVSDSSSGFIGRTPSELLT